MLSEREPHYLAVAISTGASPLRVVGRRVIPNTMAPVVIQAQILELMANLTRYLGTALLIITHNLGIVAWFANRVTVTYSGRVRKTGSVDAIFNNPDHPYTFGLLDSIPWFADPEWAKMRTIEGEMPDPASHPSGYIFRTRCKWAEETALRPCLYTITQPRLKRAVPA